MAGKKRDKAKSDDVVGFKYFKVLAGILETLHGAACARDRAHNRILHMYQYITRLLMYMFNPICSSLRLPKGSKRRAGSWRAGSRAAGVRGCG